MDALRATRDRRRRMDERQKRLIEDFFTDFHASEIAEILIESQQHKSMRNYNFEVRKLAKFIADLERVRDVA